MVSVQMPNSKIEISPYDYYIIKLKNEFPREMKKINFEMFVNYNIKNIFPRAIINYRTGIVIIGEYVYKCRLI
jgi:hypothetical protein